MLTTASENLGAGHKVSRGLATTLFFLFPAHTRTPRSLSRRPKRLAPSPSSRPGVQAPSPSSRPGGPDPQPLLQMLLQTPSPSSRPRVQIPLFLPQTRGSRPLVPPPDPGVQAPNPSSSDPGVQPPGPSSLRPGGPAPAPPPDVPPGPQPLLQTQGSRPAAPPPDPGVQPPAPLPDPGVQAPSPSSRCSSRPPAPPPDPRSRSHSSALRPGGPDSQSLLQTPGSSPLAPPPSDPGVQTRSPFPLRPGGLVPQPFLAQTQACLLPLTLTQSVPWWHSGWASACPCRGRRFHLWSQQIPPAAGDKTRGCATTPEPAATTEAQAPRADILQPEQPPQGRVPRSPAHRS